MCAAYSHELPRYGGAFRGGFSYPLLPIVLIISNLSVVDSFKGKKKRIVEERNDTSCYLRWRSCDEYFSKI